MNINYNDPAIYISFGVAVVGSILLIWAISKLFKKAGSPEALPITRESPRPSAADELFGARPQRETPVNDWDAPPSAPATSLPPASNKEMQERLDMMTQRLSDMQAVLQRQTTAAAAPSLPPETIDKLLKIIGNVTQQVDFLQKSLGGPPAVAGIPEAKPQAAAAPNPVASKPTLGQSAPNIPVANTAPGKSIGVAGGALSRQTISPTQKPGSPPPATPPASAPGK